MSKFITDENKLAERAKEINTITDGKELRKIVSALKTTIRENEVCAASAPAIGRPYRIICLAISGYTKIQSFINPVITESSGITLSRETCECIPNKSFIIPRNTEIKIMYQTPLGNVETKKLKGVAAIIFQHQLQHLDGVILSDFGLEIDDKYDDASDEEREELLKAYLDSLDMLNTELTSSIESDNNSKQIIDAIDFITKAQTGEVQLTEL